MKDKTNQLIKINLFKSKLFKYLDQLKVIYIDLNNLKQKDIQYIRSIN